MPITRRSMMQGLSLTGTSLAMAPFLRSVQAHASGKQEAMPKRFVFVVKSSGVEKFNLVPDGLENHYLHKTTGEKLGNRARRDGGLIDVALADHKLPDKLAALETFKDRMTILQSLSGEGFSGNHTSGYGALSCHNSETVAIAPTIDCMLGQHLSTGPYAMYGMAMNGRLLETGWKPEQTYCYPNISAFKKGMPVAFQASPRKAFVELFGSAIATQKQIERKLALNGNLMDFLSKDAKRVEKQLSPQDKERFARYTESFESLRLIEEKKSKLTGKIKKHAPKLTDRYDSMAPSKRIQSHFEVATAALVAGLTNVITLRPDTLGVKYSDLRLSESVHNLGHLQNEKAGNGWTGHQARKEVEKVHISCIADMAKKLDRIPEGNGTMLDNTMIVYMSCNGGDHHGGQADWPFVLLGGMANKLKMGRYIEYPKYQEKGHRTIGNLYLSLMQAAGMHVPETFGQLDSNLKDLDLTGTLAELMVS
jgi:hypothetical protein